MESQSFNVSVSQIITKNLVMTGQYEVITDEGFLRSPYRSVRFFIDPFTQGQQSEIYPNTRSSNAASVRAKYFLPYRAAIDAMYRFYTDTWGVIGHTGELGYVHPLDQPQWIFEGRVRYYTQDQPPTSTRTSSRAPTTPTSWRATRSSRPTTPSPPASSATYEFKIDRFPWLAKGALNLRYDYMTGRTTTTSATRAYSLGSFGIPPDDPLQPGTEPLYKLERQHHPVLHLRVLLNGDRGQTPFASKRGRTC